MMNFVRAWAFYAGGSCQRPPDMYTLDLRFSTGVVITKVVVEGRRQRQGANGSGSAAMRPGRSWDALPAAIPFGSFTCSTNVCAVESDFFYRLARRFAQVTGADSSQSVIGRRLCLRRVNKHNDADRDIPTPLRWASPE